MNLSFWDYYQMFQRIHLVDHQNCLVSDCVVCLGWWYDDMRYGRII